MAFVSPRLMGKRYKIATESRVTVRFPSTALEMEIAPTHETTRLGPTFWTVRVFVLIGTRRLRVVELLKAVKLVTTARTLELVNGHKTLLSTEACPTFRRLLLSLFFRINLHGSSNQGTNEEVFHISSQR